MVFTEFTTPGKRKAKFLSTSISDASLTFSKELDLNIEPKINIEPMNSIKLLISPDLSHTESKSSPYKVNISWIVSGGAPYICFLDFGDSVEPTEFKCNDRLTINQLTHDYKTSGIFKLTLKCASLLAKGSELIDSQLVYVREKRESEVNFKQMYFQRPNEVTNKVLKLELPFKRCSPGLKFKILNEYNHLTLSEWICEHNQDVIKFFLIFFVSKYWFINKLF